MYLKQILFKKRFNQLGTNIYVYFKGGKRSFTISLQFNSREKAEAGENERGGRILL